MSQSGNAARGRLTQSAPVFAALGDPTRLAMLARLGTEGPLSITRLSEGAAVTRQAITKHLHTLAGAGLVSDRRRGREHVFKLETDRLKLAQDCLRQISAQWDAAIERLRESVEDQE